MSYQAEEAYHKFTSTIAHTEAGIELDGLNRSNEIVSHF
jgi:hypothetical protein